MSLKVQLYYIKNTGQNLKISIKVLSNEQYYMFFFISTFYSFIFLLQPNFSKLKSVVGSHYFHFEPPLFALFPDCLQ